MEPPAHPSSVDLSVTASRSNSIASDSVHGPTAVFESDPSRPVRLPRLRDVRPSSAAVRLARRQPLLLPSARWCAGEPVLVCSRRLDVVTPLAGSFAARRSSRAASSRSRSPSKTILNKRPMDFRFPTRTCLCPCVRARAETVLVFRPLRVFRTLATPSATAPRAAFPLCRAAGGTREGPRCKRRGPAPALVSHSRGPRVHPGAFDPLRNRGLSPRPRRLIPMPSRSMHCLGSWLPSGRVLGRDGPASAPTRAGPSPASPSRASLRSPPLGCVRSVRGQFAPSPTVQTWNLAYIRPLLRCLGPPAQIRRDRLEFPAEFAEFTSEVVFLLFCFSFASDLDKAFDEEFAQSISDMVHLWITGASHLPSGLRPFPTRVPHSCPLSRACERRRAGGQGAVQRLDHDGGGARDATAEGSVRGVETGLAQHAVPRDTASALLSEGEGE